MHLNKKSLKQQGGQMIPMQPGMQNNQQPDPMIQKVTMMISESVKQETVLIKPKWYEVFIPSFHNSLFI